MEASEGIEDDNVYLCSPEVATAAAIKGEIVDPRNLVEELGQERFDGNRYEFQILVESPESARGHGNRLEDVFTDAITLVDSDTLRDLKREVMDDA